MAATTTAPPHATRQDLLVPVLHQLDACRALGPGQRVLVACSGGLDSTVLLDVLARVAERRALTLRVAHVDHAVRVDSAADARFVAEAAAARGLDAVVARLTGDDLPAHGSPEERLRIARREALAREARQWNADWIALGHHADDQAEWLMLRLLQGVPSDGWWMDAVSAPWVRPLFGLWRVELHRYATMRGLAWREDPTNADPRVPRNEIRHAILPWLEARGVGHLRRSLVALAREAREDALHFQGETEARLKRALDRGRGALAIAPLADASPALARRVVARWLHVGFGLEARRAVVRALVELLVDGVTEGRGVDVGGGLRIERASDALVARQGADDAPGGAIPVPDARVEGGDPF